MRIGIICEGPSDYPALACFIGHALREKGIDPQFLQLFPEPDRTRAEGGWPNVLLWLKSHPPEVRIQRYFGGGLFGGALSTEPLDAIILQLDSDVVDDDSFRNFAKKNLEYEVSQSLNPEERGQQIIAVLGLAAAFNQMTDVDKDRHVITPSVEATETWCIAAFHPVLSDYENLRGPDLVNEFMTVLEKSEGREPQNSYANIDKDAKRRKVFCEKHFSGSVRIQNSCSHFAESVSQLLALKPGQSASAS